MINFFAAANNKSPMLSVGQNNGFFAKRDSSENNGVSEEELKPFQERDMEVRDHEKAHYDVAGSYAIGSPSYEFQIGPDGEQYAVGGHVNVDTSEIAGDPSATYKKAEIIKRSALAPKDDLSFEDYQVAAKADQMMIKARNELKNNTSEPGSIISIIA